jgi:transposase
MIIKSKYTKTFCSDELTRLKYDELQDFAVSIRNFKNKVSKIVNSNLLKYLDYNKFGFITEMRSKFKNDFNSSFDKQIYEQVLRCYQNKFDGIERKIRFDCIKFVGFDLYKKNTKKNRKGELKNVVMSHEKTPLSICLTYLSRYGNGNTLNYIRSEIDKCDANKKAFYENILRCSDKFGFQRLLSLAIDRRKRVVNHYGEFPIEFKSLSFAGRSRKTRIISYNKSFGSEINSFISLSGFSGRKSFDIPVKYCKNYHGSIKQYMKKSNDYEYNISFDEKNHQARVLLCIDGDRYIPDAGNNVVGIDVNCKHNLFSLSNNTTYDYSRELVNDFCRSSIEIDNLKTDKSYVIGKRKQHKLDVLKIKMLKSEQEIISSICKTLKEQGVNHVVMEDLDNGFGKCFARDSENSDINYNRKVKFLGLSSLKNEFEHISRKYDIAVSTVQASYTSKMCPVCGCIEDENRPNQETFRCIECGHEENADFNASINIRNRVLVTVLRDSLLKQLDNGAFEPKSLKREKVKKILLSYRRRLIGNNQLVNVSQVV